MPLGPEAIDMGAAKHRHKTAPPDWRWKFQKDRWRRLLPLRDSTGQNQRSVSQQQQSNKEPHRNNVMFFAHWTYQKMICSITNSAKATPAQKIGSCSSGTSTSFGIGVMPYTSPFKSASGLGVVARLTATVTSTHTSQDQSA